MGTTVRLGPLKFSLRATIDHRGPSIHSGHYTASINCCKKRSIATITQLRSLELLIAKTPLLHMLCYMNWLKYEFWTRTGGWEFDRSHGVGTSSPSHWQQVEEQATKPVGWMMCFLWWPLFPSRGSVLMLVTFGICFKQHFATRYLVFCNPSPARMSEYRIQHGAIGPFYVTSSYSTWIFCRGVSGFATDCPCGVWCRGLTTCLLHVGPPFGNRLLNNSWVVGLT